VVALGKVSHEMRTQGEATLRLPVRLDTSPQEPALVRGVDAEAIGVAVDAILFHVGLQVQW
jgi:hypothetical protein